MEQMVEQVRARRSNPFETLAARLERRLDPLAASVLEQVRAKGSEVDRPGGLNWEQFGDFTRQSLQLQLQSFRLGALPEACPEVDAGAVEALSRQGGLQLLLNSYRVCQQAVWEAWFLLVEESTQLARSRRRDLLSRGSDFFFRYADLLSDYLSDVYRRRSEQASGSCERRRFQAVRELLDGDPLAASWLDLDLERHHLGLISWGEDPVATARELASRLGRPVFRSLNPLESTPSCWAWISGGRPLDAVEQRLVRDFKPDGGQVALGFEAFGEAGFRATHRQATHARRFATASGPGVVRYGDVAVEVLVGHSEEDARAFVAHELGGIEDDSVRSREIRETLAAYFAVEHNAASAAAALGVHQQTVANRLRAAEERLGLDSIAERRLELEIALRLRSAPL